MKIIITMAFSFFVMNAFSQQFGEKSDTSNATPISELKTSLVKSPEVEVNVKGKIKNVCQMAGCWMNLENGDGTETMVRMKDHSFAVPKDVSGNTAIVKGTAYMDTTTVEMLKHYAFDAGKSEKEIEAITEPKIQMVIQASSVTVLKDNGSKK